MAFAGLAGEIAERADYHPDILIQFHKVTLTLSTHDEGGSTDRASGSPGKWRRRRRTRWPDSLRAWARRPGTSSTTTALLAQCEVQAHRARPGRPHRNKSETAIRLVHGPSGVTAEGRDERSRTQNLRIAWEAAREAGAARVPAPPRRPTRPTRGSRVRRAQEKAAALAEGGAPRKLRSDPRAPALRRGPRRARSVPGSVAHVRAARPAETFGRWTRLLEEAVRGTRLGRVLDGKRAARVGDARARAAGSRGCRRLSGNGRGTSAAGWAWATPPPPSATIARRCAGTAGRGAPPMRRCARRDQSTSIARGRCRFRHVCAWAAGVWRWASRFSSPRHAGGPPSAGGSAHRPAGARGAGGALHRVDPAPRAAVLTVCAAARRSRIFAGFNAARCAAFRDWDMRCSRSWRWAASAYVAMDRATYPHGRGDICGWNPTSRALKTQVFRRTRRFSVAC